MRCDVLMDEVHVTQVKTGVVGNGLARRVEVVWGVMVANIRWYVVSELREEAERIWVAQMGLVAWLDGWWRMTVRVEVDVVAIV
ncbi:unnamed protein product [Sphenostylis stenocarpa]|uniref:Uncharacterized protein n=1 Tax=Sphenostylis stenocarpa TaxID=92480 RepID=A0AA86S5C9_9FABA|nr:unnamed protein product [Sphenostylis stenocarpa]